MPRVTKTTYKKFFTFLTENFPLDQPIKLKLNLPVAENLTCEGSKLRGVVASDDSSATITVAVTRNIKRNLTTIAHEYRHLIQKFNLGWEYNGPSSFKHEVDAKVFGNEQAWRWARTEGLA